jgi:tetratricopeptide (TPR) repeat protein
MICPKCQKESSSVIECNFCGIIFDKYQKRAQQAAEPDLQTGPSEALGKDPEATAPLKLSTASRRPEIEPDLGVPKRRDLKVLMIFRKLLEMMIDPFSLFLALLAGSVGYAVLSLGGILVTVPLFLQVLSCVVAFIFVAAFRLDWQGLMKDLTIDENAVRLAVAAVEHYNRAVLAEKRENYPEAAELYEKVLVHDAANNQARFNLARIYVGKLGDRDNGLIHLQVLQKTAPHGHPFRTYARDEMRRMDMVAR